MTIFWPIRTAKQLCLLISMHVVKCARVTTFNWIPDILPKNAVAPRLERPTVRVADVAASISVLNEDLRYFQL